MKTKRQNALSVIFGTVIFLGALSFGSATAKEKSSHARTPSKTQTHLGVASFYAAKFHGRRTANGEIFNNQAFTAAHRTLPFGTKVKVTNLKNGKSTIVRVNDRGPFIRGRIIDLSVAAARKIGLQRTGTARVKLEIIKS